MRVVSVRRNASNSSPVRKVSCQRLRAMVSCQAAPLTHLADDVDQRLLLLGGQPGWRDQPAPVGQFDVDALLAEAGHVDPVDPLLGADGQRPHVAGLDLVGELVVAGDAGVDGVGQQRVERLAAAGEGQVVELRGVDAAVPGDQPGQQVVGAALGPAADRRCRAGSAFQAARNCSRFWCGESPGTTMTSKSSASRAIGVTSASVASLSLAMMPPTITVPVTINVLAWPAMSASWPSPMVPAAPGMLTTCTLLTMPSALSACWDSRATRSHPPPGAAGAITPAGCGRNRRSRCRRADQTRRRRSARPPRSRWRSCPGSACWLSGAGGGVDLVWGDAVVGLPSCRAAVRRSIRSAGRVEAGTRTASTGTDGVEQDVLRGRAEQQLADRRPAAQPDDDHVGVEFAGQVDDLVGQVVAADGRT